MTRIRYIALAVILAGTIGAGLAFAQTSTPPAAKPESTTSAAQNWTAKQWSAMTKEWRKDKAKWDDCRKQSSDRKLVARKSWSFLYDCMKKT